MKRVLCIAGNGMLGKEIMARLLADPSYEVEMTTEETLNICEEEAVLKRVRECRPEIIINCAAFTDVDGCEERQQLALDVNGNAIQNLAKAANAVFAKLVHISTDYVFDGSLSQGLAYTEEMIVNPTSMYGISKEIGERMAMTANDYYIFRTAWLYGDGKNFVRTMLNLAEKGNPIKVVDDQWGNPTSTAVLSDIIKEALDKNIPSGIYHATCEGCVSWYTFAKTIFEFCRKEVEVSPITSQQLARLANRPQNSNLSKAKLKKYGIIPKSWKEALQDYLESENRIEN